MKTFVGLLLSTFLCLGFSQQPVRVCVPEKLSEFCMQMAADLPETFSCVVGRDWVDCCHIMADGKADLTNMDERALYVAGKHFNSVPIAMELIDGKPYRYQGIALVDIGSDINRPEDLQGRSSCHTGVGRTVGWQLPLAILVSRGIIQPQGCEAGILGSIEFLGTVENFFSGGSCAPGNWSNDPIVDKELKTRYDGLCKNCLDKDHCKPENLYAGYEGVVKCLLDGAGDVAFTKVSALKKLMKEDSTLANRVELLCLEGGRQSLAGGPDSLENACVWGYRPSNAFVTSEDTKEHDGDRLLAAIAETQARFSELPKPDWYYKTFFSSPKVTSAEAVGPDRDHYDSYLGEFLNVIERPVCDEPRFPAAFCTTSNVELRKCLDYVWASSARALSPAVDCFIAASKEACMESLKQGHGALVNLDGGDVYKAGRYYDLQPVSAELYGESDASYYGVAVIRSASDVSKLSELKGLSSCHTGIGRTAGWVVPVGALINDGDLEESTECDRALDVAKFFSSGSCVPGANDTKYNPNRSGAEKLCRQCIGDEDGNNKCARDSKERYSGYAGAFRCLAEGKGDVAFVKHTTVGENTDGKGAALWAKDLLSSDFKLLCIHGGNAEVGDYKNCNLAKVPSHYLMTNPGATTEDRLKLAKMLADSAKYFSDNSDLFRLFDRYGPGNSDADLLFKDSTTGLLAAPLDYSYIDALGQKFYAASEAVDPKACKSSE